MRRTLSLLALIAVSALANSQGMKQDLKWEIATDNIFRGIEMTNGLVLQPSLDLMPKEGTHLYFWGSFDFTGGGGLDDIRFQFSQDVDAVAMSGTFGITRFQRDNGFPSTTEIFGKATMPLVGITVVAYKDIDAVQGLYIRATKSAPMPNFSFAGVRGGLHWQSWLGYSEEKHALAYYGHKGAGFADLGGRMTASFGVSNGTVDVWAQFTTLVDPSYRSPGGSRTAVTLGASFGLKF